jgi:hypothetical protein
MIPPTASRRHLRWLLDPPTHDLPRSASASGVDLRIARTLVKRRSDGRDHDLSRSKQPRTECSCVGGQSRSGVSRADWNEFERPFERFPRRFSHSSSRNNGVDRGSAPNRDTQHTLLDRASIISIDHVGIQAPAPQAGIGGRPRSMLVIPLNTPPPSAL